MASRGCKIDDLDSMINDHGGTKINDHEKAMIHPKVSQVDLQPDHKISLPHGRARAYLQMGEHDDEVPSYLNTKINGARV